MRADLFDTDARKQTVSLTINSDLLARTRALGIDASRVAEAALARASREAGGTPACRNPQDMAIVTDYVAAHGDPAAELREMFGAPDAA